MSKFLPALLCLALVSCSEFEQQCESVGGLYDRNSCIRLGYWLPSSFPIKKGQCNEYAAETNKNYHGHLVHILDKQRSQLMKDHFKIGVAAQYWIGMVKNAGSSTWTWMDDTVLGNEGWSVDMDPDLWINPALYAGTMIQQEQYAKFASQAGGWDRTSLQSFCEYHNPDKQYCYSAGIPTDSDPYEGIGALHTVGSLRECAIKCRDELICRALSYSQRLKQCVLLKPSFTNQFTLANGYKF